MRPGTAVLSRADSWQTRKCATDEAHAKDEEQKKEKKHTPAAAKKRKIAKEF